MNPPCLSHPRLRRSSPQPSCHPLRHHGHRCARDVGAHSNRGVPWRFSVVPSNTWSIRAWMRTGTTRATEQQRTCSWSAPVQCLTSASWSHLGTSGCRKHWHIGSAGILQRMAVNLTVHLNGAERTFDDLSEGATITAFVAALGLRADRVALEQNGEIVPRSTWEVTHLKTGDNIELVHFVGGGLS
jgi:sulfur carrier protein